MLAFGKTRIMLVFWETIIIQMFSGNRDVFGQLEYSCFFFGFCFLNGIMLMFWNNNGLTRLL